MAVSAGRQLFSRYTFLLVGFQDRTGLVLVTCEACVFRVAFQVANLTITAVLVPVCNRKIMDLQACWCPGACIVAVLAFHAKETSMDLWLCVAIHTFRRCIYIASCYMTIQAGGFCMPAL